MARILVIDDDEQLRTLLAQVLTSAGHTVATAGDGHEGLKQFRAEPAALVVTDIVMPNQEGLATITALRREAPHLPMIAISGGQPRSGLWLKIAGLLGAGYVLPKPFVLEQFMTTVASALKNRPKCDPGNG